jgi:stalled ribosome alternative rescue factor ArfA
MIDGINANRIHGDFRLSVQPNRKHKTNYERKNFHAHYGGYQQSNEESRQI